MPTRRDFWRAVFLDQETDYSIPYDKRPKPADLAPRPRGFVDSPAGIWNKIYLESFRAEGDEAETERRWSEKWRELVLQHGEGTYNFYDTIDEAGEKPVSLMNWRVIFVCEEDVEKLRLGIGKDPLTDDEVARLEASFMSDVRKGDARKAEILAVEHERRGNLEDARRVALDGMRTGDHDSGIWENYDEDRRPQRNMGRRLLALHNRVARKITKGDASIHSTVDCGEADPERDCDKCGKKGALGAEYGFGVPWLCYGCRRLPRSEWPKPKPVPSFFSSFKPIKESEIP